MTDKQTTAQSLAEVIEQYFEKIPTSSKLTKIVYPHFNVRVAVIKKRSPRHPAFDLFRDMGKELLEIFLKNKPFKRMPKDVVLVFPERWLSVQESTALMKSIHNHPQAKELDRVSLITSSPIILTDFPAECMRILTFPDDE